MRYGIAGMAKVQTPETWQEAHQEEPGSIDLLDVLLILTQNVRLDGMIMMLTRMAIHPSLDHPFSKESYKSTGSSGHDVRIPSSGSCSSNVYRISFRYSNNKTPAPYKS